MATLIIRKQMWVDSEGRGPKEGPENIWESQVSMSLRLVSRAGRPHLISPVLAGVVEFDGELAPEGVRRLHRITNNRIGIPADDLAVLMPKIHDLFGIPDDDNLNSHLITANGWLRTAIGGDCATRIVACLDVYLDQLVKDGLTYDGRKHKCVRE
jgi:hypothetical protein